MPKLHPDDSATTRAYPNPWKTYTQTTVYDNPWISVEHHDVRTPAGTPGIYGKVHFKNRAIGIVPLDDTGHIWLVGQYRYALNEYSWEIPEGGAPFGESALVAAQRELQEETGITATRWDELIAFTTSNSVTDERGMAFLARHLSFGENDLEDTEDITVVRLPFARAIELIFEGVITDSLSIMALLAAKAFLEKEEKETKISS